MANPEVPYIFHVLVRFRTELDIPVYTHTHTGMSSYIQVYVYTLSYISVVYNFFFY
jgi:hypothetical protein